MKTSRPFRNVRGKKHHMGKKKKKTGGKGIRKGGGFSLQY